MRLNKILYSVDLTLIAGIGLLLVLGTTILLSIAPQVFPEQWIYLFLGVLIFFIITFVPVELFKTFSTPLYWIGLSSLVLPFVLGTLTRGAVRWVQIGPTSFQPSELIKPILLIFFASYLGRERPKFFRSFLYLVAPSLLVLLQPNLGTAAVFAVGWLGCSLSRGVSIRKFVVFALLALILTPFVLTSYQRARISAFLDSREDPLGAGYNSTQAMIAVGSGGLVGRGLGQGSQTQLAFLPERHTDFVFASIAEELGFLGSALILFGFFIVFYRSYKVFVNLKDPFSHSLVGGIISVLFFQFVVHIGMNMGLLPITGLPLPLVSYGGSSLVSSLFSLGLVSHFLKKSFAGFFSF